MILHSIRWRLQIWHGLLLLAVLTGFGFTAWRVASDTVWNRIDSELDESLEAVFRPPFNEDRQPPQRPEPFAPGRDGFREMMANTIRGHTATSKTSYVV